MGRGRASSLLAALGLAVAALVASGPPAPAQQTQPTRSASELQNAIGEASRAEAALLGELESIRSNRASLEARAREIAGQVALAEQKTAQLQAQYDVLSAQLQATTAKLEAAKAEFQDTAAAMYREARVGTGYDFLALARPRKLAVATKYLDRVEGSRKGELDRIAVLKLELDDQERKLAEQQREAEAQRAEVQRLSEEQQRAVSAAVVQQRAEESKVAALQAQRKADEAELAALQQSSDSIGAILARRVNTPRIGNSRCDARPVPGAVTSPFGYRWGALHAGVDMDARMGDPIKACTAGEVVIAGWLGGYGNAVVIDHGGGFGTLYGHQSQIAVSVGQRVNAGQVIGYIGSTGYSTGPHLHFEVRIGGNPVNPVGYMP
jgi:murein DD-endopeptidase MepM/ murein hydrolase activator NlpD